MYSLETSPTPYRRLRALRARSVPGSVRESVPENRGVRESVSGRVSPGECLRGSVSGGVSPGGVSPGECLRGPFGPQCVQKVFRECVWSVRTPFWHSGDTLGTLFGHSGARRARRAPETLPRTLSRTPRFSGTLARTLSGTLRARTPRSLL